MLHHYSVSVHVKICLALNIYQHNTAVTANTATVLEGSALLKCPSVDYLYHNPACPSTFPRCITKDGIAICLTISKTMTILTVRKKKGVYFLPSWLSTEEEDGSGKKKKLNPQRETSPEVRHRWMKPRAGSR